MFACFDLGLKLFHFLLLLLKQIIPLILRILLSQFFNSLCFLYFENFELFAVVLGFFDSLVDRHQLFIHLHLFQSSFWLDFDILNSTIKFLIQHLHLFFMIIFQKFDAHKAFVFVLVEFLFPRPIKFLQLLISNFNILSQLVFLNICS